MGEASPSVHSCYFDANSPKLLRRGANKWKRAENKPLGTLMLLQRQLPQTFEARGK
jgi:hypothetical protein